MPHVFVILAIIAVALVFWNAIHWYEFMTTYRYHGEFLGKRHECSVRFANSECGILCFVGANESGLYLLSHPDRKGWWRYGGLGFKKNLEIPWRDLDYRGGRVLLKECMWFHIPTRKIHFYVPREIGDKLLIDGAREPHFQWDAKANSQAPTR